MTGRLQPGRAWANCPAWPVPFVRPQAVKARHLRGSTKKKKSELVIVDGREVSEWSMRTLRVSGAPSFPFIFQCRPDASFFRIAAAVWGVITRTGESETSVQKLDRGRNGRSGESGCEHECRQESGGAEHRESAVSGALSELAPDAEAERVVKRIRRCMATGKEARQRRAGTKGEGASA